MGENTPRLSSSLCGEENGERVKERKFIQKIFGLKSKEKAHVHRNKSSSVFYNEIEPAYRTNLIIDGSVPSSKDIPESIPSSNSSIKKSGLIVKSKSYPAPAPPVGDEPCDDSKYNEIRRDEKLSKREKQTLKNKSLEREYGNTVKLTSATMFNDYRRSTVIPPTQSLNYTTEESTVSDKNDPNNISNAEIFPIMTNDVFYDKVHREKSCDSIGTSGYSSHKTNTNCNNYDYEEVSTNRIEAPNGCDSAALEKYTSVTDARTANLKIAENGKKYMQKNQLCQKANSQQKDTFPAKLKTAKQQNHEKKQEQQQERTGCDSAAKDAAEYSKLDIIRQYNRGIGDSSYSNDEKDVKVSEASIILSPEMSDDSDADVGNQNKKILSNDKNSTSSFDFGADISTKNLIVTEDNDGIVKRLSNFKLRPSSSTKKIPPIPVSSFGKSSSLLPEEIDFDEKRENNAVLEEEIFSNYHSDNINANGLKTVADMRRKADENVENDLNISALIISSPKNDHKYNSDKNIDTVTVTNVHITTVPSNKQPTVVDISSRPNNENKNINGLETVTVTSIAGYCNDNTATILSNDKRDTVAHKLPLSSFSTTPHFPTVVSPTTLSTVKSVTHSSTVVSLSTSATVTAVETLADVSADNNNIINTNIDETLNEKINAEYLRLMEMFTKWEMMTSESSAAKSNFQKSLIDQQKIVYDLWAKQLSTPNSFGSHCPEKYKNLNSNISATKFDDSCSNSFTNSGVNFMKKSELLLEAPDLVRGVLSNFARMETTKANTTASSSQQISDTATNNDAAYKTSNLQTVKNIPNSNKHENIQQTTSEFSSNAPSDASKRIAATKWHRVPQKSDQDSATSTLDAQNDADASAGTELAESFRKFEERKRRKRLEGCVYEDPAKKGESSHTKDIMPKPSTSIASILNGSKWHSESKSLVSRTNSTSSVISTSNSIKFEAKKSPNFQNLEPKSTYLRPDPDELRFATLRKVGPPRERCGIEMGNVIGENQCNDLQDKVIRKSDKDGQNVDSTFKVEASDKKKIQTNNLKTSTITVGTRGDLMEAIRKAGGFQSLKKIRKN